VDDCSVYLGSTCLCRPLYQVSASAAEASQSVASPPPTKSAAPGPGKIQKHSRRLSNLQATPETIAKGLRLAPEFSVQEMNTRAATVPGIPYADIVYQLSDSIDHVADQNSPPLLTMQGQGLNNLPENIEGYCVRDEQKPVDSVQQRGSCCGKSIPSMEGGINAQRPKAEHAVSPLYPTTMLHGTFPQYGLSTNKLSWPHLDHHAGGAFYYNLVNQGSDVRDATSHSSASPSSSSSSNLRNSIFGDNTVTEHLLTTDAFRYPSIMAPTFCNDPVNGCSCGDDCQCLGCVTHPFNNTTRQHVQQMGYLMSFNEEEKSPQGSPPLMERLIPTALVNAAENCAMADNRQHWPTVHSHSRVASTSNIDNPFSPTSPTDYASGQQLMHPSEYYTLEYPVGLPGDCSDGTCQCGNECGCIGCLVHSEHNGVSLELPTHHDDVISGNIHFTDSMVSTHTSQRIPALDGFPDSATSLPAVALPLG
jgi:hypothetical protein